MGNIYGNNVIIIQLCCKGSFLSQCELEIKDNQYNMNSQEEDSVTKNVNFEISNFKDLSPVSKILDTSFKETSIDQSRLQKLEKAIYYAKVLSISIQYTGHPERTIIINALGCENSHRVIKDGFTYFGAKKKCSPNGQVINDVKLPIVGSELAHHYRGKYFQISYDVYRDTYYITDLKLGFGTYFKLEDSMELKNNTLIMVGETYVLSTFLRQNKELTKIRLKIYGRGIGDVFYFNASDCHENFITIGRHETCDVKLQGSLVSKVHCTIFYTPEKGWVLFDGDMSRIQNSTNGTWVYVSENTEIFNSMIFKSGRILFKVSIL